MEQPLLKARKGNEYGTKQARKAGHGDEELLEFAEDDVDVKSRRDRRRRSEGGMAEGFLSESSMGSPRRGTAKKYQGAYLSDSAMSDTNRRDGGGDSNFQMRLPMIPSKARFPSGPSKRGAMNKLPRKIPRRVKGKFRRIAADWEDEIATRRVSVYCPSNELDLDRVYKQLVKVRRKPGSNTPLSLHGDEDFSFETNKTLIVPKILISDDLGSPRSDQVQRSRDNLDSPSWMPSIFFDVLHLRQGPSTKRTPLNLDQADGSKPKANDGVEIDRNLSDYEDEFEDDWEGYREVFLFGFGCLVFWNWEDEDSEIRFLNSILPFCKGVYDAEAAESAADDLEFFQGKKSTVKHDTIELCSNDPVERLAVSFAFAQSSLLSLYEFRLDQIIERNEHIPVELARHGRINMDQNEISKEIGRLFLERNMINLESDLIQTPDFFWEHDEWEPVYKKISTYLEHDDRHTVLNKRLDCVRELLDVLSSQVDSQHASKLEWIIIWLILIEVVLQVVWNVLIKDILGYFNH